MLISFVARRSAVADPSTYTREEVSSPGQFARRFRSGLTPSLTHERLAAPGPPFQWRRSNRYSNSNTPAQNTTTPAEIPITAPASRPTISPTRATPHPSQVPCDSGESEAELDEIGAIAAYRRHSR